MLLTNYFTLFKLIDVEIEGNGKSNDQKTDLF